MDETLNFSIEKNKLQGIMLQNAKNRNVLASRLRQVKTFKGEKCYSTVESVGAVHDKDPSLTNSVW